MYYVYTGACAMRSVYAVVVSVYGELLSIARAVEYCNLIGFLEIRTQ